MQDVFFVGPFAENQSPCEREIAMLADDLARAKREADDHAATGFGFRQAELDAAVEISQERLDLAMDFMKAKEDHPGLHVMSINYGWKNYHEVGWRSYFNKDHHERTGRYHYMVNGQQGPAFEIVYLPEEIL